MTGWSTCGGSKNGWPVGQFQPAPNFITDAKATTYLFLPAAVNRRVEDSSATWTFRLPTMRSHMGARNGVDLRRAFGPTSVQFEGVVAPRVSV